MERDDTGIVIGPSNGWLYAKDIFSISEQNKFLKKAGANAVEVCLSDDKRRLRCLLGVEKFDRFSYLSVHLPDYSDSRPIKEQISLTESIMKKHKPKMFLIHPLKVAPKYWEGLIKSNIPIAIENMDKNKDSGYDLKELEQLLTDFNLRFILDVQHAYEHDPSMKYAEDLFWMAKAKLTHFHVSGETADNNHVLVHRSKNRKVIVSFLSMIFETEVPIILEGEYRTEKDLQEEIRYLKLQFAE